MKAEKILYGVYAIIVVVVVAALSASFTHMHDWTVAVLPPDTPNWFGWINAVISELTPLAGSLYLIYSHANRGRTWLAWLMLGYGGVASAIGQIHAAGSDPTVWALIAALLPVTSAFILIKVLFTLLAMTERPMDLGQPAQEMAHTPAHGVAQSSAASAVGHPGPAPVQPVGHPETGQVAHEETAGQGVAHEVAHSDDEASVEVAQDTVAQVAHEVAQDQPKKVAHPRPKPAKKVAQSKVAQGKYDPAQMAQAVEAVRSGRLGVNAAAKEFDVPRSTLGRLAKAETEPAPDVDKAAEEALQGVDLDAELAEILGRKNDDET